MGMLRSVFVMGMLAALLAVGFFFIKEAKLTSGLMLAGYFLLTIFISIHYSRLSWVKKGGELFSGIVKPFLDRYLGRGLVITAGVLFLIGQLYLLRAMTAIKPEIYQKSLLLGGILCLTGLLLGLVFCLIKSGFKGFRSFSSYGFMLMIAGSAFVIWSGYFIARTSVDMGPEGRYFCLFDDAMISLRYAWNLTHGLGLVWNPGERVEGYTNLLMTLYMAIGTLFLNKNLSVLFVQISGVLFMLLIGIFHFNLAKTLFVSPSAERKDFYLMLAFASPLLYYPLTYWSITGMETGLLCVLMSASIWIVFTESKNPRFNPLLAILLGLSTLVRPDAVVQVGLIFLYRFYTVLAARKNIVGLLSEGVIFFLFPLGQLWFRWVYYHEWYPNTYTLKMVGFPLDVRLGHGKAFLRQFMQSAWMVSLLGALSVLVKFRKEKLLIVALFASVNAYQLYVGGDPWLYWRIMAPYVGLMLLLNVDLLESIITLFSSRVKSNPLSLMRPSGLQVSAVMLVWAVLLGWLNFKYAPEIYFKELPYSVFYNGYNVRTGLALEKICKPGARVGVLWAGAIPYYSGMVGVDFLGKCDKYIASLPAEKQGAPGHNKFKLSYSIEELKPDYIQQYYWQGDDKKEFVEKNYVMFGNNWYLKDSPYIHWEKLKQ